MRARLIVLLCVTVGTSTFSIGSFPTLLPDLDRVARLSTLELGVLTSAFGFARMLVDIPVGLFVTRRLRWALVSAPLVLASGVLIIGAGGTFFALLAGRVLMGFAHALGMVSWLTTILRHQGTSLAAALNAFELSAMLGMLGGVAVVSALPKTLAWNHAFLVACAPVLVGLVTAPLIAASEGSGGPRRLDRSSWGPRHGPHTPSRSERPGKPGALDRSSWGPRHGPHTPSRSERPGKPGALLDSTRVPGGPDIAPMSPGAPNAPGSARRHPGKDAGRSSMAALAFVTGSSIAVTYATIELFLLPLRASREFGLDRVAVARLLMIAQVSDIVALLPVGLVADRAGAPRVLAVILCSLASAAALVTFGGVGAMAAGAALFGLGMAGWMLPLSLLRRETPAPDIAWRTALYRVGVDGGLFLGPFLCGLLGDAAWALAATFAAVLIGLAIVLFTRSAGSR